MRRVFTIAAVLWVVLLSYLPALGGEDPSAGMKRLLDMAAGGPGRVPRRRVPALLVEIARIDAELAAFAGDRALARLRSFHRGAGPCLRYGPVPPPSAAEVREAAGRYGYRFLEENLWCASLLAEKAEDAMHGSGAWEEYRKVVLDAARRSGAAGAGDRCAALLDRRRRLWRLLAGPGRPGIAESCGSSRAGIKDLVSSFPSLVYGGNLLAAYGLLAAEETRSLVESAAGRVDARSCSFERGFTPPEDGWGRRLGLFNRGGRCVLSSYGRDGEPGGAGLDADIEVEIRR